SSDQSSSMKRPDPLPAKPRPTKAGTAPGVLVAFPPDHDIARAPADVRSPVARLTARGASPRAAPFRRRDRLCDGIVDIGGARVIIARASSVKSSTVRNKLDHATLATTQPG